MKWATFSLRQTTDLSWMAENFKNGIEVASKAKAAELNQ